MTNNSVPRNKTNSSINDAIKRYLQEKGVTYREVGTELIARCIFNDCDKDSVGNEAHLYFNANTGQYECKKCGVKGNIVTLKKHFGDFTPQATSQSRNASFSYGLVEKCHQALPERIKSYLINRGISDAVINKYKVGYGKFYEKYWITIPVKDHTTDEYLYFKLRLDPEHGSDKITYPSKGAHAQLFGELSNDQQVICEGEMDALALISQGIAAITSTHGANTFKPDWVERLKDCTSIYVCYDLDVAGRAGSEKVLRMLHSARVKNLYQIILPDEVGEKGDITDYLTKLQYPTADLFSRYASQFPRAFEASQFPEIRIQDIENVLELTIKKDNANKVVVFLCMITAYTEGAQFNVLLNSPSSTGKSYIPLEVVKLFPKDDVVKLGKCSRQAFFHEQGEYDKENNQIKIDYSRKILIFTDMPDTTLLEGLRSFLSHDEKTMYSKITDKSEKGGNRTKTVALVGYPSVIFCTANSKMDLQEQTRFIQLSPDIDSEKVLAGIKNTISRESDHNRYDEAIEADSARKLLRARILAIRDEMIDEVRIPEEQSIQARFLGSREPQPRHQRDIKRLISLIKGIALVNLWRRERTETTVIANQSDIDQAFELWEQITEGQDLNLPPFVYRIYSEIILPLYVEKNKQHDENIFDTNDVGVSRMEIMSKYQKVHKHPIGLNKLRMEILPALESAGLIIQESDSSNRRKMLVYPTQFEVEEEKGLQYSEQDCGEKLQGYTEERADDLSEVSQKI